ncbi:MAG: hypothetical protein GXO39_00870 [Thermotogae bacterium]|nr:hypothetical protein [Thermotogota bacterium]
MIKKEHVVEILLHMGSSRTKWLVWGILDAHPNVNLKEVAKHMFVPLKELRDVAKMLESWGWLRPYGSDKYYLTLDYRLTQEIKDSLQGQIMRPWNEDDYLDLYHDLNRDERRLLNRLVFSTGKVNVRTLMGMMNGEGFFKVASLERKIRNFCYDRGLAIPIERSKKFVTTGLGRTQAEYIVDPAFMDRMRSIVRS